MKSSPENPRWIIVGFQTNKNENQEQNPSIFDHCNFTCMFVMLKRRSYPQVDYDNNFTQQKFSRSYGDAAALRKKFTILKNWFRVQILPLLITRSCFQFLSLKCRNNLKNLKIVSQIYKQKDSFQKIYQQVLKLSQL